MGISFLYPALLAGLVALGIPILIHLIRRRRVRLVRFPAVRFILLSRRRIARRHRLKNLLLLLLRLGAVASFIALVAHPFLVTRGSMAGSRWAPLTVALLLDNSLSMGYRQEGGTRFELARRAAQTLLKGLGPQDRVLVLGTASSPEGWPREGEPPERALARVDSVRLSAGAGDLLAAFARAYEALAGPAYQKELILISDLARSDWAHFDLRSIQRFDPQLSLRVVHVGAGEQAPNASVRAVRWLGEALTTGVAAGVEAEVVNHSNRPLRALRVRLHAEGRVRAERRVDLAPREVRRVAFSLTPERPGPVGGWVELAGDRLPEDDRRFLAGKAGEKVRVLLVDGDPRTSLALSETFYVLHALRAAGTPSPFVLSVVSGHGLGGVRWEDFDVALLCNVSDWPPPVRQAVGQFLAAGKGVFLALGEWVDPETYNRELLEAAPRLLPARMGPAVRRPPARPARVREVQLDHPILRALSKQGALALDRARVEGYIPMGSTGGRGRILLALDDDTPLLVEHTVGPAKALVFSSSCDRDWTNLPIFPAFVPLV
ncbi:MAG: BatA domain-containing protein, partial [Nitrospinota bacterium]